MCPPFGRAARPGHGKAHQAQGLMGLCSPAFPARERGGKDQRRVDCRGAGAGAALQSVMLKGWEMVLEVARLTISAWAFSA